MKRTIKLTILALFAMVLVACTSLDGSYSGDYGSTMKIEGNDVSMTVLFFSFNGTINKTDKTMTVVMAGDPDEKEIVYNYEVDGKNIVILEENGEESVFTRDE